MRTATQDDARRAGGIVEDFELALANVSPRATRTSVVVAFLVRMAALLRVPGASRPA